MLAAACFPYLGGLGEDDPALSAHLRSRQGMLRGIARAAEKNATAPRVL